MKRILITTLLALTLFTVFSCAKKEATFDIAKTWRLGADDYDYTDLIVSTGQISEITVKEGTVTDEITYTIKPADVSSVKAGEIYHLIADKVSISSDGQREGNRMSVTIKSVSKDSLVLKINSYEMAFTAK